MKQLTLPVPMAGEEKKKIIFTLLCGASKGFMKAFKAFIKPFEVLQRSVKIKFKLTFILIQLSEMHGERRVKSKYRVVLPSIQ